MSAYDLVIRNGTIVDGTGAPRFTGDVAVKDGLIASVGRVQGRVDFPRAAPERHLWLISLMEGVEDIPGTALAEGMKWDWETFPEYLDALERMPRSIDVGTHVPHGAVRAYVLGDREMPGAIPTAEDMAQMSAIVEEGVRAGALGFSTSRTVLHKSIDGELVPGTTATAEELIVIGRAMGRVGHGVFEMASDMRREWNEFEWMGALSRETGLPVTFAALQSIAKELPLEEQIATMRKENAAGANIVAQIALRGNGIVMAWRGTVHPFRFKPAWAEIEALPWEQQLARLQDPAFKSRMLAEENVMPESDIIEFLRVVAGGWFIQFEMDPDFDYEPTAAESILARAAAAGVDPAEYAYDLLMKDDGTGFIYFPILNYADGNLDFLEALQRSDDTVNSLSDGGAHCGTICDAASPTFMLQHWVRDRKRAAGRPDGKITLENAIKRQCHDTARLYGLDDRGVIAPGYMADLNVIDLAAIKLGKPWLAFDLPAGGKRLLQKAEGYVATIKSGVVTFANGEWTGETPGGLIRGPQRAEMLEAAE
jgi:N-acyl-D-amino-acid deacylase